LARESIAETHGTALTETSNKNSFAYAGIIFFDSRFFPVLYFIRNMLVNDSQTFFDFINTVSLVLVASSIQDLDIVPTRARGSSVDGHGANRGM
jgi:hypothetical protein